MSGGGARIPDDYARVLSDLGSGTLGGLEAFEATLRRLHPPAFEALRERLAPARDRLATALPGFRAANAPPELDELHEQLGQAAQACLSALDGFLEPAHASEVAPRILRAMREHARAQELVYPMRRVFPPFDRFFAEPIFHGDLARLTPEPSPGANVGLHRAGSGDDPDGRGGFCLYVPEHYDGRSDWPLVVALHGGFGRGRDFLWTWLREARGRGFLLLAPTSVGTTWSLQSPALDGRRLVSMLGHVCENWSVDSSRILLTGLSDGATFALLTGLAPDSPFTALAPVSGVLHPANHANGNLARAAGRRIYLVHGALDWMFPVVLAQMARDALQAAGSDLIYREISDLSHAYPREENDSILEWFDPGLALPG